MHCDTVENYLLTLAGAAGETSQETFRVASPSYGVGQHLSSDSAGIPLLKASMFQGGLPNQQLPTLGHLDLPVRASLSGASTDYAVQELIFSLPRTHGALLSVSTPNAQSREGRLYSTALHFQDRNASACGIRCGCLRPPVVSQR